MAPRLVGEKERAGRSITGFHVRKLLRADELSQRPRDGKQERVGVAPSAYDFKLEGTFTSRRKHGESGQKFRRALATAKRDELSESFGCQWAALRLAHEAPALDKLRIRE
jgi:hypothetical protein